YAGAEPSRAERAGGALLLWSLVEIVLGLAGAPTPLGLLGPGSALETPGWIWAARVGLGLLGGLLVFLKEPREADGAEAARSKKGAKKDEKPSTKVRRKRSRKTKAKKSEATVAPAPAGPTTSAWGYVLLCVSTAIVYFYTAVTKLSDDWRQGHALQRLARTDATLALRDRAVGEGLPVLGVFREAGFWELMATGAILVQFVTLAGYLVAARQDVLSPRWRRLVQLALFAPLSFHLAAEVGLTLDIGWFSFYMIVIPAVVFLPAPLLRVLAAGWSWPAQRVAAAFAPRAKESEGAEAEAQARFEAGVLLVAAGATAVGIGALLDLPGALGAGIGASVLLVLGAAWAFRAGVPLRARGWAATTALGAVVMWASIAQSDVRFDYYRFVGGEYRRHGEYALALDAYERANAHVVSPWCVYEGRELLECYRRRETAEAIAEEQGLTVNERNRQRQEDEMRSYVERGIDRAEP
ncbi:MAG TPA: HTTM domain-containing protein, partial [Polyangiaceae bacterium LLY-WYZ-15_(1-7)]|nr:HTTM domain-containing protein [Polyangiaceae bacterium LLY-WYZ-15_(1-7)]